MARYWIYLSGGQVSGPYTVEQLIRLRGFSRQSQVCVDDASGRPGVWITPAEIPELAHIFKVADQMNEPAAATAPPEKAASRPPAVMRPAPARSPAAVAPRPSRPRPISRKLRLWTVLMLAAALAAGLWRELESLRRAGLRQERSDAQALVETAPLPNSSAYATIRQYLQEKRIQAQWDLEREPAGLYRVGLSWYEPHARAPAVYAFEVNLAAQNVRGLNTAASRLLSEGFPSPQAPARAAAPSHPK